MTRLSFKRETNYDSVDTLLESLFSSQVFDLDIVIQCFQVLLEQVKPSRLDGDLPKDGNAKCIGLIQALD